MAAQVASTAGCSIRVVTTWSPGRPLPHSVPQSAQLFDSVPPEVKTTSRVSAPMRSATARRASSTTARASWPKRWTELAFPKTPPSAGSIASSTAASTGVVALLSR